MKKSILARLALLLLATLMLSGCILVPVDGWYPDGDYRGRDRGGHRGDRHR